MKSLAVMLLFSLLSLDDCIECALKSSPDILSARIEAENCRMRLNCSRLEYLPSLNLYLNQYFNWGRSVDMQELQIIRNRLTRQSGASVGTSLTIFDGMRRFNVTAREKELLQSAGWSIKAVEMRISEEIARAYLECLLARELRRSLEEVHCRTEEKCLIMDELYRSGTVTRSALLEISTQLAAEEAGMTEAANDEESARSRLASLMGRSADPADFDIMEIDTVLHPGREPYKMKLTPEHSPEIRSLEHEVSACTYGVRAAKGLYLPSVSITGAYGTYYSDLSPDILKNQLRDNVNPSVTLSLSLPLFAGGSVMKEVSSAEGMLKSARARLRKCLLDMECSLAAVERECEALRREVEADRACMVMCTVKETAMSEAFMKGATSAADYIDAAKEMIQSRQEYICSLYRYLFQQKTIEIYNSYGS